MLSLQNTDENLRSFVSDIAGEESQATECKGGDEAGAGVMGWLVPSWDRPCAMLRHRDPLFILSRFSPLEFILLDEINHGN